MTCGSDLAAAVSPFERRQGIERKRQVTKFEVPKKTPRKESWLLIEDDMRVPFSCSGLNVSKAARDQKKKEVARNQGVKKIQEKKEIWFIEDDKRDPWSCIVNGSIGERWTRWRDLEKKQCQRGCHLGPTSLGGADLRWLGRRTRDFEMHHVPGHHTPRFGRFRRARWPQKREKKKFWHAPRRDQNRRPWYTSNHGATSTSSAMATFLVVIDTNKE